MNMQDPIIKDAVNKYVEWLNSFYKDGERVTFGDVTMDANIVFDSDPSHEMQTIERHIIMRLAYDDGGPSTLHVVAWNDAVHFISQTFDTMTSVVYNRDAKELR
jgi:hypothetical protein